MSVEIMAWNIRDGFSNEHRAERIVETLRQVRPMAAVFLEAWQEGKDGALDTALKTFGRDGYTTVHGLYDDTDGRRDRHGIVGIVSQELMGKTQPQLIRLASRTAVQLSMCDPATLADIAVYGVHLDDRQELRRLEQAKALLQQAQESPATVIAGDLNAMHYGDLRSRMLRAARPIAHRLPSVDPQPGVRQSKLTRVGSLASRLTDMASGTTVELLQMAGFADADPKHSATKGPFNLDHIFVKGLVVVDSRTHDKVIGSECDHRAVSAHLRYAPMR